MHHLRNVQVQDILRDRRIPLLHYYYSSSMKEMKPSVVEKLQHTLGPGHFGDGRNLFPSDFQDSLADKSSTGKDFATFFDCAKRALQSVHENNEIGLNEEALAKNIVSRCSRSC